MTESVYEWKTDELGLESVRTKENTLLYDNPLASFLYALKSSEAQRQYPARLSKFFDYIDIRVGKMENLLDQFVKYDDISKELTIKRFGEFEIEYFEKDSWKNIFEKNKQSNSSDKKNNPFEIFFTLFAAENGFHPRRRPLLWRI